LPLNPTLSTTPDGPAERLTVGGTPLFPASTLSVTADTPIYLAFGAQVAYRIDTGLGSSPRAGAAGERQTAFWRAHSGKAEKVITWVAQCMNRTPVAPSPNTLCDNEVLMSWALISDIPPDGPDGQQIITVAGVYLYELQKVPSPTDTLFVGRSPFNTRASRTLRVADFAQYIVGPSLNPAGFTGGPVTY
jgi:hypothetical protein